MREIMLILVGVILTVMGQYGYSYYYAVEIHDSLLKQELAVEFEHRFGMEPIKDNEQVQYAIDDEFDDKLNRLCEESKYIHQAAWTGAMMDAGARTAEQVRRMEFLTQHYGFKIPGKAQQYKLNTMSWRPKDKYENLKCF